MSKLEPCPCYRCTKERTDKDPGPTICGMSLEMHRMFLCQICGNKRCPHAADHNLACTGSNEPGQPGSLYEHAPSPPTSQSDETPPPCPKCGKPVGSIRYGSFSVDVDCFACGYRGPLIPAVPPQPTSQSDEIQRSDAGVYHDPSKGGLELYRNRHPSPASGTSQSDDALVEELLSVMARAFGKAKARAILPILHRERASARAEGRREGIEEAAKVAGERRKIFVVGPDVRQDVWFTPTEVAAAIRTLAEKQP